MKIEKQTSKLSATTYLSPDFWIWIKVCTDISTEAHMFIAVLIGIKNCIIFHHTPRFSCKWHRIWDGLKLRLVICLCKIVPIDFWGLCLNNLVPFWGICNHLTSHLKLKQEITVAFSNLYIKLDHHFGSYVRCHH